MMDATVTTGETERTVKLYKDDHVDAGIGRSQPWIRHNRMIIVKLIPAGR